MHHISDTQKILHLPFLPEKALFANRFTLTLILKKDYLRLSP
jgi:hypothetical protein